VRLKGAEATREHEAERAHEREGRVHLRRAQHLPVAEDEVAEPDFAAMNSTRPA